MRLQKKRLEIQRNFKEWIFIPVGILALLAVCYALTPIQHANADQYQTTSTENNSTASLTIQLEEPTSPSDIIWLEALVHQSNLQQEIYIDGLPNVGLETSLQQLSELIAEEKIQIVKNNKEPLSNQSIIFGLNQLTFKYATAASKQPVNASSSEESKLAVQKPAYYQVLNILIHPNIAYALLLLGIAGIVWEFYRPGRVTPLVLGVSLILLATFIFQYLPVNYLNLTILILGIILMVLEARAPHYGFVGLIGLTAFILGSVNLIETRVAYYQLSLTLVSLFGLTAALVLIFMEAIIEKTQKWISKAGNQTLIGKGAEAMNDFNHDGPVTVHGEYWEATCNGSMRKGESRKIRAVNGLTLILD